MCHCFLLHWFLVLCVLFTLESCVMCSCCGCLVSFSVGVLGVFVLLVGKIRGMKIGLLLRCWDEFFMVNKN